MVADGNRIVLSSVRDEHSQVYEKAASGLVAERSLSPGQGDRYATTWSPDGRFVAGIQQNLQQGGTEFLLLPIPADRKPMTFLQGARGLLRFTAAGRFIFPHFRAAPASERWE